jgi:ABC-type microcin C transport system permease subunit YejB
MFNQSIRFVIFETLFIRVLDIPLSVKAQVSQIRVSMRPDQCNSGVIIIHIIMYTLPLQVEVVFLVKMLSGS